MKKDSREGGKHGEIQGEKHASERMCVVTRETLAPDALLRFCISPDGVLTPDLRRRLPGRGIHVRASAAALREAIRRKAFERGLKQPVSIPATLVEDIAALMRRDLVQALAIANKAGLVLTGFGKVEPLLAAGGALALLEASDGAEDGQRKLRQAALKGMGERAASLPVINCLSSDDFRLAFGRDLVIHAALLAGPAGEACLSRWHRLVCYETGSLPDAKTKKLARDDDNDVLTGFRETDPHTETAGP